MTNAEFGKMLRGLADLYEQHEELPQFGGSDNRVYVFVPDKETLAASVRILGSGKKESVNDCLNYRPDRWPVSLWASKSSMGCEKIEEEIFVPKKVIPAQPERIIEAHTETRVTYKCAPFLEVDNTEPKLLEASENA